MDLFTDGALQAEVHDRFFSPAINWKNRTGPDGKPLVYANHWHAEFSTAEKSTAQRFLAVFRITPEGRKPLKLRCSGSGVLKVGAWTVEAELDASQPARLCVTDGRGNAVRYNTDASVVGGSTVFRTAGRPDRELVDEIPASVR